LLTKLNISELPETSSQKPPKPANHESIYFNFRSKMSTKVNISFKLVGEMKTFQDKSKLK
jgi:hypothetical protein